MTREESNQSPQRIQIEELPVAFNVCGQELREVWKSESGVASLAHVIMDRGADSLLHFHLEMTEVYHILDGEGEITRGEEQIPVRAGTLIEISPRTKHKLTNSWKSPLIHMVHALPAFDPKDVYILDED